MKYYLRQSKANKSKIQLYFEMDILQWLENTFCICYVACPMKYTLGQVRIIPTKDGSPHTGCTFTPWVVSFTPWHRAPGRRDLDLSLFWKVLAFGYCHCLQLSVSVCWCVNSELVCAITHHSFKLQSPNLDHRCKTHWLRSLLFWVCDCTWLYGPFIICATWRRLIQQGW